MVLANTWRRSRIIWVSLFLIANALDAITTFIKLSDAGVTGIELNPIVHYFGWPAAIATKLGWMALVIFLWSRRWHLKPSAYKLSLALMTTAIMIVALFNVGQEWNVEVYNGIKCSIIGTKYVQEILQSQLNIQEIEYFVSQCS